MQCVGACKQSKVKSMVTIIIIIIIIIIMQRPLAWTEKLSEASNRQRRAHL